ncbi:MAG: Na/Pi symporter [Planctomycetota bacterium]
MTQPSLGPIEPEVGTPLWRKALVFLAVVGLVYLLILAVGMMSGGFKGAAGGKAAARGLLGGLGGNPLLGLVLGIFATAVVQSSSTVTSVIVGLVASGLSVHAAVPMIMGANIGTAVTNTLVSLAHVTRPEEFKRAFAAATVHDMFNFLAVIIFLTIEVVVSWVSPNGQGMLEMLTGWMTASMNGDGGMGGSVKNVNVIKASIKPVIGLFFAYDFKAGTGSGLFYMLFGRIGGGIALVLLALPTIFTSILVLGKVLRAHLIGRVERVFNAALGRGPITGIASGALITAFVQSSSTTTSLVVPMAGAGVLKLEKIFPFTLGANIGTTFTALLASLAGGDDPVKAQAAVQIALVHLCFNVLATALIYGVPVLRIIPLAGARGLSELAVRRKSLAIGYVIGTYFLLPLALLGISRMTGWGRQAQADAPAPAAPASDAPAGSHEPATGDQ